uniref:Syndecan 1 n=1 Tax=Oryctolagus cuniculus TaxID=9986 RepID=A0A5F9CBF9_RABIT
QSELVTTNVPPEDQDGSGDDSDNFSGSGAGPLQDHALSRQTPATWKDLWLLTATSTAPEPTSADATAASTPILPAGEGPVEEGVVPLAEAEPGSVAGEKETTAQPRETTQLPTTQRASTARATTAQAPATTHPHRDVQPGHHGTSAPAAPGHADTHSPGVQDRGPSATDAAAEDGAPNQLPAGEGSGEPDFTFETSEENTAVAEVEPDPRNQPPVDQGATGASQGLLDRKEVLGGVIAGGLVGLIFAPHSPPRGRTAGPGLPATTPPTPQRRRRQPAPLTAAQSGAPRASRTWPSATATAWPRTPGTRLLQPGPALERKGTLLFGPGWPCRGWKTLGWGLWAEPPTALSGAGEVSSGSIRVHVVSRGGLR